MSTDHCFNLQGRAINCTQCAADNECLRGEKSQGISISATEPRPELSAPYYALYKVHCPLTRYSFSVLSVLTLSQLGPVGARRSVGLGQLYDRCSAGCIQAGKRSGSDVTVANPRCLENVRGAAAK